MAAKQLVFDFEGTKYTLEFTRKTVETMERQGFVASDVVDKPMSTLPALFAGAFLANHRFIKKEVVDRIFSQLSHKAELIERLADMYNEPIQSMVDEPEESVGNVSWEANW